MYEIKIGPVLKRQLKTQHLSLKEVSLKTGIPYSTLHTWLENRHPKDIIKVQKLADYLGLTLQQLVFDSPHFEHELKTDELTSQVIGKNGHVFKGLLEIIIRKIE